MASRAYSLPNILTYARIVAVPLVVLCFFLEGSLRSPDYARWWAFGLFVAASVTDWLDGYLARIWQQTSTIGRMLDPIADKLLVAASLLLLAAEGTIAGWALWAAIIILCREILVSGLREYLAELKVSVPVTRVAKWKTFIQMLAIAFLLAGPAADNLTAHYFLVSATATGAEIPIATQTGLVLLWIAAVITLYTGYDYFRAGLRHIED